MSKDDIQTANIERKGTIRAAWIAFACGIVGAIAGAVTSVYITEKQLSLGRQTLKTEILQKQIEKLEEISQQLARVNVDLGQGMLPEDCSVRKIKAFHNAIRIIEPSSHLFSRDSWGQLAQLAKKLDDCIMAAKTGNPPQQEGYTSVYSKIDPLMERTITEIADLRRTKQDELTRTLALIK